MSHESRFAGRNQRGRPIEPGSRWRRRRNIGVAFDRVVLAIVEHRGRTWVIHGYVSGKLDVPQATDLTEFVTKHIERAGDAA